MAFYAETPQIKRLFQMATVLGLKAFVSTATNLFVYLLFV